MNRADVQNKVSSIIPRLAGGLEPVPAVNGQKNGKHPGQVASQSHTKTDTLTLVLCFAGENLRAQRKPTHAQEQHSTSAII